MLVLTAATFVNGIVSVLAQFFRGSDCMGMAYEFATKLGLPSTAAQRVQEVLNHHLQQYITQHNPTYDPTRPFETGLDVRNPPH
jgi:hypothetical protein